MSVARILRLAQGTRDVAAFRQRVLEMIRRKVPFDAGLFHELSPRAPLSGAALVGIDAAALAGSQGRWDDDAVALGRLRDRALQQGGIATDTDAFPPRSAARRAWNERVARPLGIRSALVAHLVVHDRIVSAILLGRRRGPGFGPADRAVLSRWLPALSVSDAMIQSASARVFPGLVTGLRCVDERLTERQREIVVHVALGHTNAETARALGISPHTVRNLLVRVQARLGASNRAEVVRLAVLR
jgi:DNA-binding CsgD family transcriptional regulator